jgi:IclR family pca regulon transcriptional regulator
LAATDIPGHTSQSLTCADAILQRVETAREQGYCVTDSEFEAGIIGYAVPVSRPDRTPIVIGSSAPRGQNPEAETERLLRGLQLCAAELRQAEAVDHL